MPPPNVVPYRVFPEAITPQPGLAPPVLVTAREILEPAVKVCRTVKPIPSVLTRNTVPFPELPPVSADPYNVPSDGTAPDSGWAPSLPPVKLYRFVNSVPSVLIAKTVPLLRLPPFNLFRSYAALISL